jgi:CBS domain-containing protein
MSKSPMTVLENASFDAVKDLMKKTSYRHFPVMSTEGRLVGIISDRDLYSNSGSRITEIMTKKVITVVPKAPLREVVALMLSEKLPCLPVIDSTHAIIGIVTSTDILKTFLTHPPVEIWR